MRPRRHRFTALATATAAAVAMLAGCNTGGGNSASLTSGRPILIGASLSLTGQFSADGKAFERGYKLWLDDVNAHGGLLGRPLRLIILNDNSAIPRVKANYRTLIRVDHVNLTFGPFSSLLTGPAAETVGPLGYAMIEGAGAANLVFQSPSNAKYHNVFCPSLPVEDYMGPVVAWIKSLPPSKRPKTAAYPTVDDIFAAPAVQKAQTELEALGIKTVYRSDHPFQEAQSAYKAPAQAVAAAGAQMVVLGSTDVPTVAAFMSVFQQNHYNPQVFIAFSGPDQGQAFLGQVGQANADGMMVPDGWYGSYDNALNNVMVEDYIAHYGGTAAGINADVAEAYSVGEVAADAVSFTGGTNNDAIMKYLRSGITLETVQGPVQFNLLGENPKAAAFVSQWQSGSYVQVLPPGKGSTKILFPKPTWGN